MFSTKDGGWSPYVAGALSGLLIVLSVFLTGKYFGASTSFVRISGMVESLLDPGHVTGLEYFSRFRPEPDWQLMFVGGILIGALISSLLSGSFRWSGVPPMWEERFGPSPLKRGTVAFLGGAIALFGARIAGGCTSGHGLSGTLQLAVSGFIVMAALFAGGMLSARMLYGGAKQ